jgi:Rrf2 family protein
MLRLSKKADYALMAMKHLARNGSAPSTSAREIAEKYDIPIELMAKVLQRLVRIGLLASTQGTRGGYTLGRSPAEISVVDVIEAIDGPFTVTACSTEKNDCDQFSKCSIRDPLWQIREKIAAALGTVTIAEIAAETVPGPVPVSRAAVLHHAR